MHDGSSFAAPLMTPGPHLPKKLPNHARDFLRVEIEAVVIDSPALISFGTSTGDNCYGVPGFPGQSDGARGVMEIEEDRQALAE